jgi:hypothetical protein
MGSLSLTIDRAMNNIGKTARGVLRDAVMAFDCLAISDEERVSAIATALASAAVVHHHRHSARFLDAVRIWALESKASRSMPLASCNPPSAALVAEGAEIIAGGTEALLAALTTAKVPVEDRAVAELTLYTRLLEHVEAPLVLAVFTAIADAVALPGFRVGQLVHVMVPDRRPVPRDADLATLATRGTA